MCTSDLLACGAAPALVSLAGEGVVKDSAGAAGKVAKAFASLLVLPASKAALVALGAVPALAALGAQPAVAASPEAAERVGEALALLQ